MDMSFRTIGANASADAKRRLFHASIIIPLTYVTQPHHRHIVLFH